METSKFPLAQIPLNQWIEHVSQDFISEGEAKNVHIRYQLDPRIEKVSFDKDKCEIILSNLLDHSIRRNDTERTLAILGYLKIGLPIQIDRASGSTKMWWIF